MARQGEDWRGWPNLAWSGRYEKITISEASMTTSKCKACGKEILFAKTIAGRLMPFDAAQTVVLVEGQQMKGHVAHWVTCPAADQFRKGKSSDKS